MAIRSCGDLGTQFSPFIALMYWSVQGDAQCAVFRATIRRYSQAVHLPGRTSGPYPLLYSEITALFTLATGTPTPISLRSSCRTARCQKRCKEGSPSCICCCVNVQHTSAEASFTPSKQSFVSEHASPAWACFVTACSGILVTYDSYSQHLQQPRCSNKNRTQPGQAKPIIVGGYLGNMLLRRLLTQFSPFVSCVIISAARLIARGTCPCKRSL